jgi:hypothetical protein
LDMVLSANFHHEHTVMCTSEFACVSP